MPNTWPLVQLGELLTPVSRPETVDADKTYRILGAHWYAKGLYVKDITTGAGIQAKFLYRVEKGDFVYNRLFAWKGSFALTAKENHGCYVSNEFPCFAVNPSRLDGRFLWRFFSRSSVWDDALSESTGGTPTSRNRLKEHKFLAFKIPLPPLDKQRRIVARIEQLAAKMQEARGLRQKAAEQAGALIDTERAALFDKASKEGAMRLDDAATLERGKFSHRPRNEPRFFGGEHPWIQIEQIESSDKYIRTWSQTLNDDGLAISRKFPKGTLLISIAATIGAVGILDFDCCVPDSIVAVTPKRGFDSEYLYHYLIYVRRHLEDLAPQSAQKNINLRILSPLQMPVLPISEQRRIVTYLDNLQAKVDALKRLQAETAAELDALMPSILDKAFRGEL